MARLRTLKPRLPAAPARIKTSTTKEVRMTGRKLQDRRLRVWTADPKCAACGRFTLFPHGFELDHKTPLFQGGADTDENCQVLCVEYDDAGRKTGCHAAKSADEGKG
jgi:5-methylcytosine-specific restriction protein A